MSLHKFRKINERGVTMIEYALLLAAVVLVILAAFDVAGVATAIGNVITEIKNKLVVPS